MLSEVGDPIMEDENESESKKNSRLVIPSSKNKSSPNRQQSHYESLKHPNMMQSDGTASNIGGKPRDKDATSM